MTKEEILWGDPIKVDGKMPAWVHEDDWDKIAIHYRGGILYPDQDTLRNAREWIWREIQAIQLRADDPRYQPTNTGPTDAERRLAELVAEHDRLNARVSELLAANTEQVNKRRALAEQNDKLAAGLDKMQERIADLRSDLDGARHENGTAWAIIERQNGLLGEAAKLFREYEAHHNERAERAMKSACRASSPQLFDELDALAKESAGKAQRNAEIAARLEAAIEPIQKDEPKLPEWRFDRTEGCVRAFAPKNAILRFGAWTHPDNIPEGAVYDWRDISKGKEGDGYFQMRKNGGAWGNAQAREVTIVGSLESAK